MGCAENLNFGGPWSRVLPLPKTRDFESDRDTQEIFCNCRNQSDIITSIPNRHPCKLPFSPLLYTLVFLFKESFVVNFGNGLLLRSPFHSLQFGIGSNTRISESLTLVIYWSRVTEIVFTSDSCVKRREPIEKFAGQIRWISTTIKATDSFPIILCVSTTTIVSTTFVAQGNMSLFEHV